MSLSRMKGPRRESGVCLVEIVVAGGMIVLGLLAHGALTIAAGDQILVSRSRSVAHSAVRAQLAILRGCDFRQCFASFDEATANDPVGAVGPHFDVEGLSPAADDADGHVGRVIFPVVSVGGADPVLREDVVDDRLSMPRDLDGDGAIDALAKDESYVRLPVLIEVRWQGRKHEHQLTLYAVLTEFR